MIDFVTIGVLIGIINFLIYMGYHSYSFYATHITNKYVTLLHIILLALAFGFISYGVAGWNLVYLILSVYFIWILYETEKMYGYFEDWLYTHVKWLWKYLYTHKQRR
jgi:hypothetical protein